MGYINAALDQIFGRIGPGYQIAIGLALFFFGMKIMGRGLKVAESPEWLAPVDNPYLMAGLALAVTMVWQSSSLTTALLVPLAATGQIGLATAIGGMLGANVGTTFTAHLAALFGDGYGGVGRAAAFAHTGLNLVMAAAFLNPWSLRAMVWALNKTL